MDSSELDKKLALGNVAMAKAEAIMKSQQAGHLTLEEADLKMIEIAEELKRQQAGLEAQGLLQRAIQKRRAAWAVAAIVVLVACAWQIARTVN